MRRSPIYALYCMSAVGCGGGASDPCAGYSGGCLGLLVEGSGAIARVDQLDVHMTGAIGDYHGVTPPVAGAPHPLPVTTALLVGGLDGMVAVEVAGLLGGAEVGRGAKDATVAAGSHQLITVVLIAAASSDLSVGDLAGTDLAGADLAGADLAANPIDLAGADLAGCGDPGHGCCANATCAGGATCGPCAPGDGWTAVLINNRNGGNAEQCPTGWKSFGAKPLLMDGLKDPGCSPCTCGAPTGVSCTATVKDFADSLDNTCMNTNGTVTIPGNNQCFDGGVDYLSSFVFATGSGPMGGSCVSTGGGQRLALTWTTQHDLCEPASPPANCVGDVCLPAAMGTYQAAACVAKAGDLGCPMGFLQVRHLFYGGASDQRTCGPNCTCGPPSGSTCANSVTLYPCPVCCANCGSGAFPVTFGSCIQTGNPVHCNGGGVIRSGVYQGVKNAGACAGSNVVEGGNFVPGDPWTVCCTM